MRTFIPDPGLSPPMERLRDVLAGANASPWGPDNPQRFWPCPTCERPHEWSANYDGSERGTADCPEVGTVEIDRAETFVDR